MKATYEIIVDEAEPGGIQEQIAFLVDETGGEIVETYPSSVGEEFNVLIIQWPTIKVIDGELTYGFVHPMFLVEKIQGVLSWRMKNTYKQGE